MPRRQIKPEERGRKPCISSEGPLVPYQVKLPKSLKAWCMYIGPKYIRYMLGTLKGYHEQQAKEFEERVLYGDPEAKAAPTGFIKATGEDLLE